MRDVELQLEDRGPGEGEDGDEEVGVSLSGRDSLGECSTQHAPSGFGVPTGCIEPLPQLHRTRSDLRVGWMSWREEATSICVQCSWRFVVSRALVQGGQRPQASPVMPEQKILSQTVAGDALRKPAESKLSTGPAKRRTSGQSVVVVLGRVARYGVQDGPRNGVGLECADDAGGSAMT